MAQLSIVDGPIIRAGESLSERADFTNGRPVRIVTPVGWDDAPVTFQVSVDGIHFDDLYFPDGTEVSIVCNGLGRAIVISPDAAIAVSFVKFRSGPGNSPVVQTEERMFLTVLDNTVSAIR